MQLLSTSPTLLEWIDALLISSTIINLAHHLGLEVIAEGIETEAR